MKEWYYDKLLNIDTVGIQKEFKQSSHYYRYEATPYSALLELFNHYELNKHDRIVDFGCGKGRLNFFAHYLFDTPGIGVEMNQSLYERAVNNKNRFFKGSTTRDKIQFYHCLAEEYEINPLDNRFYFFNPFSIQIFMAVINNILLSAEKNMREMDVILYYPSDEYIYYLNHHHFFELKMEIILPDIYNFNPYERFLIYRLVI